VVLRTSAGPVVVVREPGRTALRLVVGDAIEIGRDCTGLLLTDPQISRRHLKLRVEAGRVLVTDLGSTNGSILDGRALTGTMTLEHGSTVRIGDTTLELLDAPVSGTSSQAARVGAATDLRRTSIDIVADAVAESLPQLSQQHDDQGTLSLVFSDIEASTRRAESLGDQKWFDLLSKHNEIVRHQVAAHRGTEIKAQGDGFMLTFPSARSAVLCMVDVQRDLAEHSRMNAGQEILIRVGVHTGEVITADDGDVFGKHVILAARVANEALGGEILVSSLVHEIIESRGDIQFGAPRTSTLKGLNGEYTMFPILWE